MKKEDYSPAKLFSLFKDTNDEIIMQVIKLTSNSFNQSINQSIKQSSNQSI